MTSLLCGGVSRWEFVSQADKRNLPFLKVHFVANAHPLQVNSRVGLLRAFEGFSFVSGLPFPDKKLVLPGRPSAAGPETASMLPLTVSMTFQVAMWLSMVLSVHFTRVGNITVARSVPFWLRSTTPVCMAPLKLKATDALTSDWIGKKAVLNHHREVPYRLLRCDDQFSAGDPDSGNLLVQGDNLLALKALLPYYAGRVKCIYIDPPYNTGNEKWVYNDAVNSPEMRDWWARWSGLKPKTCPSMTSGFRMMYPRLSLLK